MESMTDWVEGALDMALISASFDLNSVRWCSFGDGYRLNLSPSFDLFGDLHVDDL